MSRFKLNWKYILGEVALIFIGINLAIWFNNWNQSRQLKGLEIQILEEIRSGMEADLEDLNINKGGHMGGMRAAIALNAFYLGDSTLHVDSLINHLWYIRSNYSSLRNMAPYEFLKSKGISIISNDSLRRSITHLYEYKYQNLHQIELMYAPMQFYQNHSERIWKHLKPYLTIESGRITPMEDLTRDEVDIEFVYTLGEIRSLRGLAVREYNETIGEVQAAIRLINKELESLK